MEQWIKKQKDLSLWASLVFITLCFVGTIGVAIASSEDTQDVSKPLSEQVVEEIAPDTILTLVNVARKNTGVPELVKNDLAVKAAQQKCDDMVANNYYKYVSPTTGRHGYQYAIDLIPHGTLFNELLNQGDLQTNQGFVDSWVKSEGHKKTMLDPRYTDTGVAVCKLSSEPDESHTIVQEFIEIKGQQAVNAASASSRNKYLGFSCTKTPIPYKTVYKEARWLYVGETSSYGGTDGYLETCNPDSNGFKPPDFRMPPSDKVVQTGTRVRSTSPSPQTPPAPTYSYQQARQVAQNQCSPIAQAGAGDSSAYQVCIQTVLRNYGY